jgi:hypothetical protein
MFPVAGGKVQSALRYRVALATDHNPIAKQRRKCSVCRVTVILTKTNQSIQCGVNLFETFMPSGIELQLIANLDEWCPVVGMVQPVSYFRR